MKKNEVKVGGLYKALVNGKLVTVRVDDIRQVNPAGSLTNRHGRVKPPITAYDVTNLTTGRKTTFRSAQKFRGPANRPTSGASGSVPSAASPEGARPDPTPAGMEPPAAPTGTPAAVSVMPAGPAGGNVPSLFGVPGDDQYIVPEDERDDRPLPEMTAGEAAEWAHPEDAANTLRQGEQGIPPGFRASGSRIRSGPGTSPRDLTELFNKLSSKVVAANDKPAHATPAARVAGYTPTEEQAAILEAASQTGLQVLVIGAGAGTGKTSTLKMLEAVLPGVGQYTAFNKSLVAESKAKFRKARCNTTHSLAFGAVGRLYAHRLDGPRVKSYQVARQLGLEDLTLDTPWTLVKDERTGEGRGGNKTLDAAYLAGQVTVAVRRYCQSDDDELAPWHFAYIEGIDQPVQREDGTPGRGNENNILVREYLLPYARKAWADLSNPRGTLPFSPDVYVKVWALGRGKDAPVVAADYLLVDEAQDLSPVFLGVLRQQAHALVVLVGDDNQQIYEWRGAVNAMAAFPEAPRRLLSQSFRFGQAIADVANAILAGLQQPTDLVLKGLPSVPSRVGPVASPRCYLYRTNAGAVGRLLGEMRDGRRGHLIGGGADVVEFVRAARDLEAGCPTRHPELGCFDSWAEVQAYVKTDEGGDLKLMVKLVDDFGADAILLALGDMPKEDRADFVVSTAHKSKGREWPTVKLGGDFPPASRMGDADRRLLYVAATRAQEELDLTECPPFMEVKDRDGGTSRPIPVRYTAPMPTAAQLEEYRRGKAAGHEGAYREAKALGEPGMVTAAGPAKCLEVPLRGNGRQEDGPRDPGPAEFTWANLGDGWTVRGPGGNENTRVVVTRRNGTTSREQLGRVVKALGGLYFYEVV